MQPLWTTVRRFVKTLKAELSYDPTILLLGTHTPGFIAALFIIAEIWKQPKCPSTGERIKKIWYTYTMGYYSGIKNETSPFGTTCIK